MKVCFHVILVFLLQFICRYLKYLTCRNHAFLGEGIVIIAINEPPSTYAFGSTGIFQFSFELEGRRQGSQKRGRVSVCTGIKKREVEEIEEMKKKKARVDSDI